VSLASSGGPAHLCASTVTVAMRHQAQRGDDEPEQCATGKMAAVRSILIRDVLVANLGPPLEGMGFVRNGRKPVWTQERLQIRTVVDSKAKDPYRGGAFTLEFEVCDDARFEEKLAGRVRVDQLLDDAQRSAFLGVRNAVARRLQTPPPEHMAAIDPSLHEQYFKPFLQAHELEAGDRFWMRFRTVNDLTAWCSLIASELPTLVARARDLPAHELMLGKPFDWS
jgi:hypothetical protein